MDKGRSAVSFAMSILVSMRVDRTRLIGPDRHFLEICRSQGKGVPTALLDL
jgi:hypothetical protein